LLLAACARNPFWVNQPEPEKDANMLELPDRAGIVVLPVQGVDGTRSAALTAALVAALQEANVPAGSGDGAGNRGSQLLTTTVAAAADESAVRVDLAWELVDHAGLPVGTGNGSRVVPQPAWQEAAPAAMAGLAGAVAPRVAALVQEDLSGGSRAGARQRVHFAGLTDAPGDGAAALPRLVAYLLNQNGYRPVDGAEEAISVAGHFRAEPAADGMETVAIQWRVTDSAGQEIGVVNQENVVPQGALDGPWGDAALYIAEGAVRGVHALLVARQVPAE
jgi:hypothetical protein